MPTQQEKIIKNIGLTVLLILQTKSKYNKYSIINNDVFSIKNCRTDN
jgi:hypothetical protein